eukprot:gene3222-3499_t
MVLELNQTEKQHAEAYKLLQCQKRRQCCNNPFSTIPATWITTPEVQRASREQQQDFKFTLRNAFSNVDIETKQKAAKQSQQAAAADAKSLFPAQLMFKWLSYGNDSSHAAADGSFPNRREICLTLEGDIFVRYQSYKKVPTKIDIGPVYTHNPRQRAKYARDFKPMQREVVIDIDMTDYDELRTCGSGGHICSRCWPFMAVAIEAGEECIAGWQMRGGLAKLGFGKSKHPALQRAEGLLNTAFREEQVNSEEGGAGAVWCCRYVPDQELTAQLAAKWAAGGQGLVPGGSGRRGSGRASTGGPGGDSCCLSVRRWDELVQEVNNKVAVLDSSKGEHARANPLRKCLSEIVFAYSYPRLDAEVTKKMNHLLKAPFCVHPKTGKVCVPIDPSAAWEFDPDEVPTVQQLCQQLAERQQQTAGSGAPQSQQGEGWQGTVLEPYIKAFNSNFLAPLASSSRAALNAKAKQAAAEQRGHRADQAAAW